MACTWARASCTGSMPTPSARMDRSTRVPGKPAIRRSPSATSTTARSRSATRPPPASSGSRPGSRSAGTARSFRSAVAAARWPRTRNSVTCTCPAVTRSVSRPASPRWRSKPPRKQIIRRRSHSFVRPFVHSCFSPRGNRTRTAGCPRGHRRSCRERGTTASLLRGIEDSVL